MKIISGGQTGADMGGLLGAEAVGIATGGWVPRGRRTERGPLSDETMKRFGLKEHRSSSYSTRTEANVAEADGTAIFGKPSPGTNLTVKVCQRQGKPFVVNPGPDALAAWLIDFKIDTLNVAGNRESVSPGIELRVRDLIVIMALALGWPGTPQEGKGK